MQATSIQLREETKNFLSDFFTMCLFTCNLKTMFIHGLVHCYVRAVSSEHKVQTNNHDQRHQSQPDIKFRSSFVHQINYVPMFFTLVYVLRLQ